MTAVEMPVAPSRPLPVAWPFGAEDFPEGDEFIQHRDRYCWCQPRTVHGFRGNVVVHRETVDSPWSSPRDEVWG